MRRFAMVLFTLGLMVAITFVESAMAESASRDHNPVLHSKTALATHFGSRQQDVSPEKILPAMCFGFAGPVEATKQ